MVYELIKTLYRFKIRVMFFFGLGFGEVAALIGLVKDILILLGAMVLLFKFHFGIVTTILICVVIFISFVGFGIVLYKTGLSAFGIQTTNSINPELQLIRKIAKHLGIEE